MLGSAETNRPLFTLTSWVKGTNPFELFKNWMSSENMDVTRMCSNWGANNTFGSDDDDDDDDDDD